MKKNNTTLNVILIFIGIGIWVLVYQNYTNSNNGNNVQDVYVRGGTIDSKIQEPIDVSGNVKVINTVDVDLRKVNGWNAANYYEYSIDGKEFHSLGTK